MYSEADLCALCVEQSGLCERHAKHVLPQLARPGWIRLIGHVLTEQKRRQTPKPERIAIERVKRRNARKVARAQRGYLGLAQAIGVAA